MIRCPRCESWDVHRSRLRGGFERVPALVGLLPRRCSACGWRGLRIGQDAGAAARAEPATVLERSTRLERESEQSRRRRRRSHAHRAKSPAARRIQALVIALSLGLGIGLAAQTCAGGDVVAAD